MTLLTRWVLAHKRIVVIFWVLVTLVGMASANSATKSLKQKFSVPGKEGWVANEQIARDFNGTGGNTTPLLAVVTLPAGQSARSSGAQAELRGVESRLQGASPGTRLAGYASTGAPTFVLSPRQRFHIMPGYPTFPLDRHHATVYASYT